MRRRRGRHAPQTAEDVVRIAESLHGFGAPARTADADQWEAGLRAHGIDVVIYLRARRWLRRGKPLAWSWREYQRRTAAPVDYGD